MKRLGPAVSIPARLIVGYDADRLAMLLHCNRYEAIGRIAVLLARCRDMQTDRPGLGVIDAALGTPEGVEILVETGLATVVGCEIVVRHVNLTQRLGQLKGASRGGKARTRGAARDRDGRLLPRGQKDRRPGR